jgi:hypothetical protein
MVKPATVFIQYFALPYTHQLAVNQLPGTTELDRKGKNRKRAMSRWLIKAAIGVGSAGYRDAA